jgi:branched-chain amino acid transport system substrate-binding protein
MGKGFRSRSLLVGLTSLLLLAGACSSSHKSTTTGTTASAATTAPAGSTGSVGSAAPATGSVWNIGTVGSYTGPEASSLGKVGEVVDAWAKWENAHGGINGHQIHLINMDDKSEPATSKAAVQSMVENSHVIAIVAENSIVDSAWASYVQAQGVPVIGAAIFNSVYGTNPDFFPMGTNTVSAIYGELALAKAAGKTKFGLFYCAEAAACAEAVTLYKSLTPALKINLAYTAKVSAYSSNFTAQCLAAKSAGVDVATSGTDTLTATRIAANCAQQNYKPIWVGQDGSVTAAWLHTPALDGALTVQPVFPYGDTSVPNDKAFHDALQQYAPDVVNNPQNFSENDAEDWAAGMLFEAAAKAGQLGDNPTPAQVKQGLYKLQGETLGGIAPPLTFTPNQPTVVKCYFVMGISKGQFTTPQGLKTFCQP